MERTLSPEESGDLFGFIAEITGIRLPDTLFPSVAEYVSGRLALTGGVLSSYLSLVRSDRREFDALMERVTIGETYFFRDERQFSFLDTVVFPSLRRTGRSSFLAWSAACSTGEEALSLSLLFDRHLSDVPGSSYRVFATDINRRALELLSSGCFRRTSIRSDGAAYHFLLEPYLQDSVLHAVKIAGPVLDCVVPEYLNFSGMDYSSIPDNLDIVFLRNVMIYIEQELRETIFGLIAGKLRIGGCIFISATEIPLFTHPDLELREHGGVYYYEKTLCRAKGIGKKTPESLSTRRSAERSLPLTRSVPDHPASTAPAPRVASQPAPHAASRAAPRAAPHSISANRDRPKPEPAEATQAEQAIKVAEPAEATKEISPGPTESFSENARAIYSLLNENDADKASALIDSLRPETSDERALREFLLGYSSLRAGDTRSAVSSFSRCLEHCPRFWIARYHRGLLASTTDRDSARRDFIKAKLDTADDSRDGGKLPDFLLDGFNVRYFREMCAKWIDKMSMTEVRHGNR